MSLHSQVGQNWIKITSQVSPPPHIHILCYYVKIFPGKQSIWRCKHPPLISGIFFMYTHHMSVCGLTNVFYPNKIPLRFFLMLKKWGMNTYIPRYTYTKFVCTFSDQFLTWNIHQKGRRIISRPRLSLRSIGSFHSSAVEHFWCKTLMQTWISFPFSYQKHD